MKNARKFSWDEYFDNQLKYDKIQNSSSLFDETSSNNYYVFVCFFKECKETGAIYVQRENEVFTLLEQAWFYNCSSTTEDGGGSVYFSCYQEGQFVQHQTCYYASVANQAMAFHHNVRDTPTDKNHAFDVSVFRCGENEEKGSKTFLLHLVIYDLRIATSQTINANNIHQALLSSEEVGVHVISQYSEIITKPKVFHYNF